MQLNIRRTNVDVNEQQRIHIERCLQFALGRNAGRVNHVTLFLSNCNGPRGGMAIICRIVLKLHRGGQIVVSNTGVNLEATVAVAFDRAAGALGRQHSWSRSRTTIRAEE